MIVALGQSNPLVGDIEGNARKVMDVIERAREGGADLVVLPELATLGYPPKDLLLREEIIVRNLEGLRQIAERCVGIAAVVGHVGRNSQGTGLPLQNCASLCADGRVHSTHAKSLLPNYDVFDERRYFQPAEGVRVCRARLGGSELILGVNICEDLWNDEQFTGRPRYVIDPIEALVRQGAQLLVNISASPYWVGKQARREALFSKQVREHAVPLVYVNQVGGNDDLIFDGASMVFDAGGARIAQARAFAEDVVLVDLDRPDPARDVPYPNDVDGLIEALVLGTRDYVRKCGFREVVVGLSGGIDSAVVAVIAARALGAGAVHGVSMPSRYSSQHSVEDAQELARSLGISLRRIPIFQMHQATEEALRPEFAGRLPDSTEENIQARIRGQILMALSNKFGWLVLSTGNKSELAVGYCTLYGDMCGGLAMLSDVAKTTVYRIARRLNEQARGPVIPQRVLDKPPSAELRENQTDQDSLPPYDLLDEILSQYVEQQRSVEEIIGSGLDAGMVADVVRRVERNEYKRRQSAPGLKVTERAFGVGWRMPIAAGGAGGGVQAAPT